MSQGPFEENQQLLTPKTVRAASADRTKPPILGLIQRGGQVTLHMLENVQQATIKPINTMEAFWSLLRSWLRPHCGISQEKLPIYTGFFQFIHNARKRGKQLLAASVGALVT